ncbi:hypothetical protein [Pedobacter panaciterrae]
MELNAEERFDDGRYNDQEDAAAKPGGCNFGGVLVTVAPFLIDFNCTDEPEQGSYRVHQLDPGLEITSDFGVCLLNARALPSWALLYRWIKQSRSIAPYFFKFRALCGLGIAFISFFLVHGMEFLSPGTSPYRVQKWRPSRCPVFLFFC